MIPYPSTKPKYNELCDAGKVVGGLSTDINDLLRTGIVKDGEISTQSNGIDSPEHIIGVVRDPFDAIEAARAAVRLGRKSKAAEKAAETEIANSAPAPSNPNAEVNP